MRGYADKEKAGRDKAGALVGLTRQAWFCVNHCERRMM
jgi:hypothetical protein